MTPTITAAHEFPIAIDAGGDTLLAIATWPPSPRRTGVVLLQGGSLRNVSFERNRAGVDQARQLAQRHFPVMRFDYSGIGDSTGSRAKFDINDPPVRDLDAVLAWMRDRGVQSIVLVALCMGARTALIAAAKTPGIAGLVLGAMPTAVRTEDRRAAEWSMLSYLQREADVAKVKRLLDPERRRQFSRLVLRRARAAVVDTFTPRSHDGIPEWVSRPTVEAIGRLVDRRIPLLLVYGQQDPLLRDFEEAMPGRLGSLLESADGLIELSSSFEGAMHGLPTLAAQQAFTETVTDWLTRRFS